MAEYEVSLHVDLGALTAQLQRALQRAIDLTSFGLMAAERAPEGEGLSIVGAWFQFATAGNEAMDFAKAKVEFRKWVVANGLRDSIEAVGGFLEGVRKVSAAWSFIGQDHISGEIWNAKMIDDPKKFERMGLPDKLDFLRKHYDFVNFPDSTDDVLTINNARNSLVHRFGVVSNRDLNTSDGMLVRWRKLELVVKGGGGERVIIPPATVQGGEVLVGRQAKASRLFRIGENVVFSPQEFAELSWTLYWFGRTLVQNLEAFGRAKGIKFTEAPPPAHAR